MNDVSMRTQRSLIAILLPIMTLGAPALAIAAYSDELPDRLATHWSGSGAADGSMSLTGLILFTGGLFILPGLITAIGGALYSHKLPRGAAPFGIGLGVAFATMGAVIILTTVIGQRGLTDWTMADVPNILLIGVLPIALGAVAAAAGRSFPYRQTDSISSPSGPGPSELDMMPVDGAERLVFVETQSIRWVLWLLALAVVATFALLFIGIWQVALLTLLMTVPGLAMGRIRVQVDRNGVTVRSALVPIRYSRIKLSEIESAATIDVEPMKWGGWGYRGSLRFGGTAAFVSRKGPGMRLDLTQDRLFAVTLNDPDTPTRLINTLVTT